MGYNVGGRTTGLMPPEDTAVLRDVQAGPSVGDFSSVAGNIAKNPQSCAHRWLLKVGLPHRASDVVSDEKRPDADQK